MTNPKKSSVELSRELGVLALSMGIFNCTVGGGIFRLPGAVFMIAGKSSPWIYILCGALIGMIGFVFAHIGKNILKTGGPYAYVSTVFGPYAGFLAGVLGWLLGTFAMASVMDALISSMAIFGGTSQTFRLSALTLLLLALTLLNLTPNRKNAKWLTVLSAIKLFPLLLFVIVGISSITLEGIPTPSSLDIPMYSRASMLLIFAFMGIESALVPGQEIKNPTKTVPLSLFISLGSVVALYILIQLITQSVLGEELSTQNQTPLISAAQALMGTPGKWVMILGSMISMFGFLSSMVFSVSRILFAMAEDHYLPAPLKSLHPINKIPHVAIMIQGLLLFALIATSTFDELAIYANVSAILLYIGCILSALRKNMRENAHKTSVAFYAASTISLLTMTWILSSVTLKEWSTLAITLGCFSLFYWRRKFILRHPSGV